MYTRTNYHTKAALKRAVAAGEAITVFQPSSDVTGFPDAPLNGTVTLEGPHWPAPHRWYAVARLRNGVIVSVS